MTLTDRELLLRAAIAFEAMPVAAKARKMLKGLGEKPVAYAGNGSWILAATMAKMIRDHLEGPPRLTLEQIAIMQKPNKD
jgi:hypothetical protein